MDKPHEWIIIVDNGPYEENDINYIRTPITWKEALLYELNHYGYIREDSVYEDAFEGIKTLQEGIVLINLLTQHKINILYMDALAVDEETTYIQQ